MTYPFTRTSACYFLIALILSGYPLAAEETVTIKEPWVSFQNPTFTLFSAAKPAVGENLSLKWGQYQGVLRRRLGDFTAVSLQPDHLYLFKDERTLAPYLPPAGAAVTPKGGFMIQSAEMRLLLFYGKGEIGRTLLRQYGMATVADAWPAAPWWLRSGIADYYSTFIMDKKGLHYGALIKEYASALSRSSWMPWEQLLGINDPDDGFEDGARRTLAQAQAWALVHLLLSMERTPGASALSQYLERLKGSQGACEALSGVYPVPDREWEAVLRAHLKRKDFPAVHAAPVEWPAQDQPEATTMSQAQILQCLGELLVRQGSARADGAESHFKSAQMVQPENAAAEAGLGQVALLREDYESAAAYFRNALAREQSRAWFHYGLGIALLEKARSAGLDAKGFSQARGAFQEALSLRPGFREAEFKLAESWLLDGLNPKGLPLFEQALLERPQRVDVARQLLSYYVEADDTTRIERTLAHIHKYGKSRDYEAARETVLRLQIDRVAALIKKKNYAGAIPLADRLRRQTSDTALIALLDEAQATAQQGKWVEVYNRGVRSAAGKKYDQAEKWFKQVLAGDADADLREQARTNLGKVRVARQAAWYNQAFNLMRANQFDQAVPLFRKVVQDDSDPQTTRAARSALDQIERLKQ